MSTVTVFTKPQCAQCKATFRALDKQGIDYKAVDVTEDAQGMEQVRSLGYRQMPVVMATMEEHWAGFNPGRIAGLSA